MSPLDDIRIASPCSASWEAMEGDDRVRYCEHCRLNVYNLSEMSRQEAVQLVSRKEGRQCLRFYRRRDGTILTNDCPVGLRTLRRAAWRVHAVVAASLLFIFGLLVGGATIRADKQSLGRLSRLRNVEPFATIMEWIDPTTPVVGW